MNILGLPIIQGMSLAGLLAILWRYLKWERSAESIDDREKRLRESVVGLVFTRGSDTYIIKQIDNIWEADSLGYRIRKRIPILRDVRGEVQITIRSDFHTYREYVWNEDDEVGIDFNTYLQEEASSEYPQVEYIGSEHPNISPGEIENPIDIQLCIHSLDQNTVRAVVEEVPKFHEFYFENYPGDGRFQLER